MTYVYRVKPFLLVLPQSLYGIAYCIEEAADRLSAEMGTLITSDVLRLGGLSNTGAHFYGLRKSYLDEKSLLLWLT
jgi:hypothetical protein